MAQAKQKKSFYQKQVDESGNKALTGIARLLEAGKAAADEEKRLTNILKAAKEQAYITILKASTPEEVAEAHDAMVTIVLTGMID